MKLTHDHTLTISVAHTATSRSWKNKKLLWSELVEKLATPVVTSETIKEFIAMPRIDQGRIKDVGGYVGGAIRGGRRTAQSVLFRQILTLDIDFAHPEFWQDFQLMYGCAAVLHATHKHQASDPRLRLIIPVSRELNADEYQAVARAIAGDLGIDLFDNTTFQPHRLMYWPSTPRDVEYYMEVQDGLWLDADEVLARYADWRDISQWPTAERHRQELTGLASKQEDPELKRGIVGVFCRTYPIEAAIQAFLSDVYTEAGEGRYTYVHGSTSAGVVIYDDKFAYSHHGTDPCSGKLVNAFDMVRLHKFGHLDSDDYTGPITKARSFEAMEIFAREDDEVKMQLAREKMQVVAYDFAEDTPETGPIDPLEVEDACETEAHEAEVEPDLDWMKELEADRRGTYLSSSTNINLILSNDARLKGAFKINEFNGKRYVCRTLPWRRVAKPEPIKNVDYSGVRNYIETVYGISAATKVEDSLALEFERNTFHPIKDYLEATVWDGVPRVETLLIDYFGAADNIYTREAIRKTLCGGIARIYNPGCKFDLVLTLISRREGKYKSMFIDRLSAGWFSDTFLTVHGKDALEQIQGAWIIEIAELAALRKADAESIKHFISKREDTFRPAYARTAETFPRQCIFIGTTNVPDFLMDPSGNRRFMPIEVDETRITKSVPADFTPEQVAQVWAEAKEMYENGEALYLSPEASEIAVSTREVHTVADERRGLIEQYLDTLLPDNWDDLGSFERQMWLADESNQGKAGTRRMHVCIAELWVECLGKSKEDMSRYNTRDLNDIMRSLGDWAPANSTRNFKNYGKQKYYVRTGGV